MEVGEGFDISGLSTAASALTEVESALARLIAASSVVAERLGPVAKATRAALASQKGYVSLYLMSIYGDPALSTWFVDAHRQLGKVLDMGKSCLRVRNLDDISLPIVGQAIAKVSAEQFVATYEAARAQTRTATRRANARSTKTRAAAQP